MSNIQSRRAGSRKAGEYPTDEGKAEEFRRSDKKQVYTFRRTMALREGRYSFSMLRISLYKTLNQAIHSYHLCSTNIIFF